MSLIGLRQKLCRITILIFILSASSLQVFSTGLINNESLNSLLVNKDDTTKVRIYLETIAQLDCNQKAQIDSLAGISIALSKESKDSKLLINTYQTLSEKAFNCNNYVQSMDYSNQVLKLIDENAVTKNKLEATSNLGVNYYYTGNYEKALQYFLESLRLSEILGDSSSINSLNNNIGIIYNFLKDSEKALAYYKKVIKGQRSTGDYEGLHGTYLNIGNVFYQEGDIDRAFEYYHKCFLIADSIGNKISTATALTNMGIVYADRGKLSIAIDYYKRAYSIYEKSNFTFGMANSTLNLADAFLKKNNLQSSKKYLQETIALSTKIGAKHILSDTYQTYSQYYKEAGNLEKAYSMLEKHIAMKDSILNETSSRNMIEMQSRYEIEKQTDQNALLRQKNQLQALRLEKERNFRKSFAVILILFVALMIALTWAYITKRKTNRIMQEKNKHIQEQNKNLHTINTTKNKFISILAHDLKNPFHAMLALASLLHENFPDLNEVERKEYIADLHNTLINTYQLLENLLNWSKSQSGLIKWMPEEIDLEQIIEESVAILMAEAENKDISIQLHASQNRMVYADKNMLQTVIRNLLHNAIKFSFRQGVIEISNYEEEDYYTVTVKDSGIGIDEDNMERLFNIENKYKTRGTEGEESSGLGLLLCKEFVEKNGGEIKVQSTPGNGSTFYFTIPKAHSGTEEKQSSDLQ